MNLYAIDVDILFDFKAVQILMCDGVETGMELSQPASKMSAVGGVELPQ